MTSPMDNLRRMASPAGPLEGPDPVAVTRRFTSLRTGALAAALAAVAESAEPAEAPAHAAVIADLRGRAIAETLAVLPDGTASLYDGNGAALLGAGGDPGVRAAATALLMAADRALPDMPPADSIGLPGIGVHAITVVVPGGPRRVDLDAAAADADAPIPETIAALHAAALDVILAVRRAAGSEA